MWTGQDGLAMRYRVNRQAGTVAAWRRDAGGFYMTPG